jgi:hypothetical protein
VAVGGLYTSEGRALKSLNMMDSVEYKGMVFQIENRMKAYFRFEGETSLAQKCHQMRYRHGAGLIIILLLAANYYIINRPGAVISADFENLSRPSTCMGPSGVFVRSGANGY